MTDVLPEHSEHGASSAKRFRACPGSVNLTRTMREEESEHAALGTAAHSVAATCLQEGNDPADFVGRVVEGVEIPAELADPIREYVEFCRGIGLPGQGLTPARVAIEQKLSMAELNPPAPMFGTADFVKFDPPFLYVADYKNGVGVKVKAAGNDQLAYYGLLAFLALTPAERALITHVKAWIVQPRHPSYAGPEAASWTIAELWEFQAALFRDVEATLPENAPLAAGSWCADTFCKARFTCVERTRAHLATAGQEWMDDADALTPRELTPEERAEVWHKLDAVVKWAEDFRNGMERDARSGVGFPGLRLATGQARESWRGDSTKVGTTLAMALELPADRIYQPREPVSPAQARAVLVDMLRVPKGPGKVTKKDAEERAKAMLKPFVQRLPTPARLVQVDSPRPVLPAAGSEYLD